LTDKQRPRIGLALGGGVVRGLAHIGVYAVLQEQGIPIDCVSGTSVGAVIAAAIAGGVDAGRLLEYADWFAWRRIIRPVWPRQGIATFEPMANWMRREFGDLDFSNLELPCVVVASDIVKGEPILLSEGNVADAVQASCSVPGFIRPVEIDGRLLCDGGVTNMVPISALRAMDVDYAIGVDIFTPAIRRILGPVGFGMAALEILLQHSGSGLEEADCLIKPDLKGRTYMRFSQRMALYELGRQATLEKIEDIHRDLELLSLADHINHDEIQQKVTESTNDPSFEPLNRTVSGTGHSEADLLANKRLFHQ